VPYHISLFVFTAELLAKHFNLNQILMYLIQIGEEKHKLNKNFDANITQKFRF